MQIKFKYSLLLFSLATVVFAIISLNSKTFAGTGDTTVVQTLRFDSTMRAGVFLFPTDTTKTYEKITMFYGMRCKGGLISTGTDRNKGCGEWDYNCYTYVVDSSQTDSLRIIQNSHSISNSIDTAFKYTSSPVWSYLKFIQHEVIHSSILFEDSVIVGYGIDSLNDPFNTANTVSRSQYLWKADELSAAGLSSGNIYGLRLNFLSVGSTIENLRIRIKNTTQTEMNENNPETNGFTEVYFLNTALTLTGKHNFNFYNPYNWNGTSNIIIEFSFTNKVNGINNTVKGYSDNYNKGLLTSQNDSYLNNNGSISYININPSVFPLITDKITIGVWVYGDSLRLPANTSILEGNDSNDQRQINIHLPWSDSNVYWDCGNDGTGYDRISVPATTAQIKGKWNFWAFTKNANTGIMEIYLNGLLVTSGQGKTKMIDIKKMIVGMGIGGANPYLGNYDELSIWNKNLSPAGILQIMNKDISNSHPDFSNLIAYYKLNEGISDTAHDSSPNNNNSYIVNPTWRTHRGNTLFRNFSPTIFRPNITFVKGDYTTSNHDYSILDSVIINASSVISYDLVNNQLIALDTIFVWPAGFSYIYNTSGAKIDSIAISSQDTIFISKLIYYLKRPMRIELINFITPYGINLDLDSLNGKTWEFDVTDYTPLLKGARYLAMEDGKYQEENDIKFVFYEGIPPRNVKSVSQIWPSGTWVSPSYNDINTNKYFEPRNIVLSSNASQFKIKSAISGHGQQGEFNRRVHTIRLNNNINFSFPVWKGCADNPIYPQGGTWVYDRAGWCPGSAVDIREFEITNQVNSGDTINIDYSLPIINSPGSSNYRINNQLVSYEAPNFVLDAAVSEIKTPSKRPEFIRSNPICNSPVVIIKNTGSALLTSLDITYGRVDGIMSVFHFEDSLNFLDTVLVSLPAPDWHSSSTDKFIVIVSNPNGNTDQYSGNDTMYSSFDIPAVYPPQLVFDLKTNNAGYQTAYVLTNSQGDTIINRKDLGNNIYYKDTVYLNNECYTVYLSDIGHNGLSWWANTGQGTGYFRIIDPVNSVILKTFNPDFGDFIYQQFSIDISLPVIETNVKPITNVSIYPNPSIDIFTAELSLPLRTKAKLMLMNVMGELLLSETFIVTQPIEKISMDISSIQGGIYFVVVEAGNQRKTLKLAIVK